MDEIVLIGAGGYCAGVIDSIESENKYKIIGITDPKKEGCWCGYPILGTDEFLQNIYDKGVKKAHVTVGSIGCPTKRKELVEYAEEIGFELVSIVDKTAVIAKGVSLGKMVYVGKKAVINAMTDIGDYCIINTGCIIEHGCCIDDWVHVAPGSTLAADISIGKSSHVGIGTTILQGLTIGHNTVIGAGSVVVRNVPSEKTVYGVVKG